MPNTSQSSRLAGPVDITRYGVYRISQSPTDPRQLYRITGRIDPDGCAGAFTPRAGRYHLYSGWFCPWAQRVVITRTLAGLGHIVSLSYVDNERDGRGWAFRERYGPDPVNGFSLLRQAYDATEEAFDGHVSVPALWDRATARLVSNDYTAIGLDFATAFERCATPLVRTYPEQHRDEIDDLDQWLGPAVNHGVRLAAKAGVEGDAARTTLLETFAELDHRLTRRRHLVGDTITEADIRLWVTLVRYDVGPNARRAINPGLHTFPHLWGYARDLYRIPAFRDSTDFATFTEPGAVRPDWHAPTHRPDRSFAR